MTKKYIGLSISEEYVSRLEKRIAELEASNKELEEIARMENNMRGRDYSEAATFKAENNRLRQIIETWRENFAKLEAQNRRLEQTIEEYDELYDSLNGILSGVEIRETPPPGPRKTKRNRYLDCMTRIILDEK